MDFCPLSPDTCGQASNESMTYCKKKEPGGFVCTNENYYKKVFGERKNMEEDAQKSYVEKALKLSTI